MIATEQRQLVASSLSFLPQLLHRVEAGRVLLVLDRHAINASGAEPELRTLLSDRLAGVFEDFKPNPSSDQPLHAARHALSLSADTLVALGGGSCLDVAKVASLAMASPDRAKDLVTGGANADLLPRPVIAIPTTSGTGSEATHFSAIYVHGKKISVAHPGLRPVGVILDPRFHIAMPTHVAAATGLDALCQAVESRWAVAATDQSIAFASEAQDLILSSLVQSVLTASPNARERMMLGSHKAGRAINTSKTTAAHALSYELTTRFGIAHGVAVALTLGYVASFNGEVTEADCTNPLGAEVAQARVHSACAACTCTPDEMPAFMRHLLARMGLPTTLRAAGVTEDALPAMADAADVVRLSNNPRRLRTTDALAILRRAFA